MRKYGDYGYKADKGNYFVLTEKGKAECKSWSYKEVGKPVDEDETYTPTWAVENDYVMEIPDPDWVTLPGYKVVYTHKGYELTVGNPYVFHDREMAERYMRGYKAKYGWFDHETYIIDATYEGKRPKPCREYKGKRVYNSDYWTFDGAEVGDLVEDKIVDDMANCVPPTTYTTSLIQCGEPFSHIEGKPTYATFKRIDDDTWMWCGNCFKGKDKEV